MIHTNKAQMLSFFAAYNNTSGWRSKSGYPQISKQLFKLSGSSLYNAASTTPASPSMAPSRLGIFVGTKTPPVDELDPADDADAAVAPPVLPVPVVEALVVDAPVLVPLPCVGHASSVAIAVNVSPLDANAALQISLDTFRVSSSSATEQPSCDPAFAQRQDVALLLIILAPVVH